MYGERVRSARLAVKENQTQFAAAVGLDQSRLSQLERGSLAPSELVRSAIAVHSGLPVEWFEQPPSIPLAEGSLLFRARTSLRAADREQAIHCAQTVHEHAARMRSRVVVAPPSLPDLGGVEPSAAAAHARDSLGVPRSGPVANVMHVVEKAGVLALGLPLARGKHDAFSTWVGRDEGAYPLVAVLAGSSGDRRRFSVAHELGHLVLHRGLPASMATGAEPEADAFAAEFLVPSADLADELPTRPTLS